MMYKRPLLNLMPEEEATWKNIQDFRLPYTTQRRQVTKLFWAIAVEAFGKGLFICSFVLAGITAELAYKTKLREQGVEIERRQPWGEVINHYAMEEETKKLATEIKEKYRNPWVHANIDEIESFLKNQGGPVTSSAELNVALASGLALKALCATQQLLTLLFCGI